VGYRSVEGRVIISITCTVHNEAHTYSTVIKFPNASDYCTVGMNVMKDGAFNNADADSNGGSSSNSMEDDSVWGKGDNDSIWGMDQDDFSVSVDNAKGTNTTRSKAILISRINITTPGNKLPPTNSTSRKKLLPPSGKSLPPTGKKKQSTGTSSTDTSTAVPPLAVVSSKYKRPMGSTNSGVFEVIAAPLSSKPVEDINKGKGTSKKKNETNKKTSNRDDAREVSNFDDSDGFQVPLSGISEDEFHVPLSAGEPRNDPFDPLKYNMSSPSLFAKSDGDIADSDMTMDDLFMQKTNSSLTLLPDRLNKSFGDLPLFDDFEVAPPSSPSKKNGSTKEKKASSRRNKNNYTTGKPPSASLNSFPLASTTGEKTLRISDMAKEERGSEKRSSEKSARSEKSSRVERSTDKSARSERSTEKSSRAERSVDRQMRGDRPAEKRRARSTDGLEKARRRRRSKSTDGLRDQSFERSTHDGRSKASEKPPSDRNLLSPTLVTRPVEKSSKRLQHSPGPLARSRRTRSPGALNRSRSPGVLTRSRSSGASTRSRSPGVLGRSRSPGALARNRTKRRDKSAHRRTEDLLKEIGCESNSDKKQGEPKRGRRPPDRSKSLDLELMSADDRSLDDGLKVADANTTNSRRYRNRSDEKLMESDSASRRRTASSDRKLSESDETDLSASKIDVDGKSLRRAKSSKQRSAGLHLGKDFQSAKKSRRRGHGKSVQNEAIPNRRLASTDTTVIPPPSEPPVDQEIESEVGQVTALSTTTDPKVPNRKKSGAWYNPISSSS
jgi:hypothetical protein